VKIYKLSQSDVFDKHRKKIAIETLKMSDEMAGIMGGMSKQESVDFLVSIGYSDEKVEKILRKLKYTEDEIQGLGIPITVQRDRWTRSPGPR